MNSCIRYFFFLLLLTGFVQITNAQVQVEKGKLSAEFKTQSIARLCELMNENYVFPKVAQQTEVHLKKQLKSGYFDQFTALESFAEALTQSVQEINKDKHMRIRPMPVYEAQDNSPERMIEEQLQNIAATRRNTAGFKEVKKLEGNVGYLDLRGFAGVERGGPIADNYMALLSTSDAIIIDVRKNGGGSPEMVQYLCSYFFTDKRHLNSLYWRQGDQTQEFWTLEKVNGKQLPEVPLFVLTSSRTFSAAEEFSYNMQTQKRATLVGETTGGGANPGGTMPINDKLLVFIPTGKAINPITKTNWEGVGVIPEVKTTAEAALDKAHELAQVAAEAYREKNNQHFKALFTQLQQAIEQYSEKSGEDLVVSSVNACITAGLLNEGAINQMGYDYLMNQQKPKIAKVLFLANVRLFPESANVYDSYGECLVANGEVKMAVEQYEKAVKLAKAQEDPNVALFEENLSRVKGILVEK